jgi:hypothetical protein
MGMIGLEMVKNRICHLSSVVDFPRIEGEAKGKALVPYSF